MQVPSAPDAAQSKPKEVPLRAEQRRHAFTNVPKREPITVATGAACAD
jgi:hypothetical protein